MLYLRDRAQREGWRAEPRFTLEQRAARASALQADLGDRDYDAVLYGAGRSNRVAGRPACSHGLGRRARRAAQTGDEVVSYDGQPHLRARQDRWRATVEGDAGRAAPSMVVRRDGEELRIVLPRGPIGVRLQPDARAARRLPLGTPARGCASGRCGRSRPPSRLAPRRP